VVRSPAVVDVLVPVDGQRAVGADGDVTAEVDLVGLVVPVERRDLVAVLVDRRAPELTRGVGLDAPAARMYRSSDRCQPQRGVTPYEDVYKLTYARGPSGIIVMLAEELEEELTPGRYSCGAQQGTADTRAVCGKHASLRRDAAHLLCVTWSRWGQG
jgi:hypothetical protein